MGVYTQANAKIWLNLSPRRNKKDVISAPFYWHVLTLIPAWMSNYIQFKLCDEITYPSLNFNGCTVEVQEWMSYFSPQFTVHDNIYPCWD